MAVTNLPRNPTNFSDEFRLFESLQLKNTPLTTVGPFSVTSESSGITYSTTNGGEEAVLENLRGVIGDSIIDADDINDINKVHLATINGRVLEFTIPSWAGDDNRPLRVEIPADLAFGGNIQVEINGTIFPLDLRDQQNLNVTQLNAGYYTFIFKSGVNFFFLAPSSSEIEWGGTNFSFIINFVQERLYHCDSTSSLIYELDIDTKLEISNAPAPSVLDDLVGTGGINTRLYLSVDGFIPLIYELDINTKLQLSSETPPSPFTIPQGIGGIDTRLYHCNLDAFRIYELDINTKLEISSAASPFNTPTGIGGIGSRLYHCDAVSDLIYELDINTKLAISNASAPSTDPRGIGGISSRLYHCDAGSADLIYELNPDTKLQISNASAPSLSPQGVGGITGGFFVNEILFNSIVYELTNDSVFKIQGGIL